MKLPDVTCYSGRKLTMTNFSLFFNLVAPLKDAISGNLLVFYNQVICDVTAGAWGKKF